MTFLMTISLGNLLTFLGLIGTVLVLVVKISRFTSTIERRIDKLESNIANQAENVAKLEHATKIDIAKVQTQFDTCYVKPKVKELEEKVLTMDKLQVELRAQLPLRLEALQQSIDNLSAEVKEIRDILKKG